MNTTTTRTARRDHLRAERRKVRPIALGLALLLVVGAFIVWAADGADARPTRSAQLVQEPHRRTAQLDRIVGSGKACIVGGKLAPVIVCARARSYDPPVRPLR